MAKAAAQKQTTSISSAAFSKAFFNGVPKDDLVGLSDAEQTLIGKSLMALAGERKSGAHKLRVFNPDKKRDGWQATHTVIEVVNDDMPFIIDSITAELSRQNLMIDKLLHPILSVLRKGSQILAIGSTKKPVDGGQMESVIHIQLEEMLSSDAMRALQQRLDLVLADVRSATKDWRRMLECVDHVYAEEHNWVKTHTKEDIQETKEFLGYLKNNNFTFLGYRQYKISHRKNGAVAEVVDKSGLGVLSGKKDFLFGYDGVEPELAAFESSPWPVVVVKLIDHPATVHRSVPMDAIAIKIMGKDGTVTGMHVFVGLFTSSTYSCRTIEVPIVRQKVQRTLANAGFVRGSHDAKALEHILEKMPRDELFQVSTEDLQALAHGVLSLQIKNRIALFTHMDPLQQYMSCLVYVPRDRYNTQLRKQAAKLVEKSVAGNVVNAFTSMDDSPLARMLYIIRLDGKQEDAYDHAQLEKDLQALGREWDERLKDVLTPVYGKIKGAELTHKFGKAFTSAYHESISIDNAVHDIRHIEQLLTGNDKIHVDLYRLQGMKANELRMKVYHIGQPVALSDILPVLEHMGLRSISEMPYEIKPQGHEQSLWIHDFILEDNQVIDIDQVKQAFEETFLQVWNGKVENDGLNALVLGAQMNWREVLVFRAYMNFLIQARFPYSRRHVIDVLDTYPKITKALLNLFKALHDPAAHNAKKAEGFGAEIDQLLQDVQKLDHDRILRSFRTMIEKTLRTNYFQPGADGEMQDVIAMKMDSKNILDLPLPRPHVEIFVYSARVEAVHLRGGEIARGGIRWSDRRDDFRTEVLGLLKSQQVKNTVIVPVGAKGGFIVKQPPKTGGREAFQAEGIECYKIFVQALLDITDNNAKGKVVRPKNVVCHDGEDTYLVVAADKGTATFSDIANSLSLKAGFWMNDAFASGGSAGYDHKGMGITAKGGWESVKRHFREMGKDIQKEPFTVAGVGDMGGDVFGNAMLLSKHIKLVAAFNHVHIFIDPTPDTEKSFAERKRLFDTRGGWDNYNKNLISAGGGVYERSAKSIKITPQVKKLLGISADQMTPDELMNTILKAEVELMWLGGIGTYIKSARQSHADADDKANDNVRVDGHELRAKVLGEGANLGATQLGRVEFGRHGGRLNTDFIDNSAGVDCSDHEVNIKILLNGIVGAKKMTLPARNKLLEKMTDDVSKLVLRDNYQQSQSLSLQEARAAADLGLHVNFIRSFEKAGLIKRSLEGLPDEESLARLGREGFGLTRPELAVLTSYSKIVLYNQILASDIPDDKAVEPLLFDYFPAALHKYKNEIKSHRLRREIIATQITNTLVNRMGPVFVASRMSKTGKSAAEVVKAFLIVAEAYDMYAQWQKIEDLDNKVPASAQLTAFEHLFLVGKRAVTWFLRFGGTPLDISKTIDAYQPGIRELTRNLLSLLPDNQKQNINADKSDLTAAGVPAAIGANIGLLKLMASASDIINLTRKSRGKIADVAGVYFYMGDHMGLDWLRSALNDLTISNAWQARVKGGLMDEFFVYQAQMAAAALNATQAKAGGSVDKRLTPWLAQYEETIAKIRELMDEVKASPKVDIDMLVLTSQRIGQLAHAMSV